MEKRNLRSLPVPSHATQYSTNQQRNHRMPERISWIALIILAATLTVGAGITNAAQEDQQAGQDQQDSDVLRAGIIGLDTSHVVAFTKTFNDPDAEGALAKVKVTDAYPGGSPDIPNSANRLEGFTNQLREMGVTIHDSIPAMLENVDVVLLESIDGRPHLEQAIPVIKAGKPLFIDKPLAASLTDALAIDRFAEQNNVPWFSSSSLRFSPGFLSFRGGSDKTGDIIGCSAWSPAALEPHHPDLFWYGIHGVEILYTIMGTGCETVSRTHTDGGDVVTGIWKDGGIGTFRGLRAADRGYGAMVFGKEGIAQAGPYTGYKPLVERIAQFFVNPDGELPVSNEETLEIYTFMAAADESKRQGGKPVSIQKVREDAQQKVDQRLKEVQ